MNGSATENRTAENLATRLGLVPGAAAVSALERQVTGERIRRMADRSTRESVLAAAFAAAAVVLLWPLAEPVPLLVWFALTQLPSAARTVLARGYRRTAGDVRDSRHPYWAHRFSACSAASGVLWGGIVVLLPASGSAEIALLIGLHAAYLAFAAGLLTAWLPAFLGFALSSTLAFLGYALIAAEALPVPSAALLVLVGAGATLGACGSARALVEALRVHAEREEAALGLLAARERAELELQSRNRFLAAASHDLRQPVHALGLFAAVLRTKVRGSEADAVAVRIQQSIDALSAMFDSILDISKLDADGMDNVPRAVPLDALLARIADDHELRAQAKGLSLTIEGRTDLIAQVDPTLLERVLMNLVGNAIKFTERGGVTVTVLPDGDRLSLSVRDTGRGIAESERGRIFTEYHQSSRADRAAGQGLGLAIVKRLCGLMDVSIELISAPGEGSDFRLSIPCGTSEASVAPVRARTGRASGCRSALVIDGERDILDGTRALLAQRGCRATVARSTTEALRRFAETHGEEVPDVLIIDIGLRGLAHGLEAVQRVRDEFNIDVPALLTTGDTTAGDPDAVTDGSIRVLRKPCSAERLWEALAALPMVPGESSHAAAA